MNPIWIPIIKGGCIAIFMAATTPFGITDWQWWIAIISLNIMVAL